ncbi:unnamed protein product [Phaeothamnion confervicola]
MIAYLIYDTATGLSKTAAIEPTLLAHHIMGLTSHVLTRALCHGPSCAYTLAVFLAEASTPFLHAAWMLNKRGLQSTAAFKAVVAVTLALFFVFRVVLGPLLLCHMWMRRASWGAAAVDRVFFGVQLSIVLAFVLLNWFWFAKLIRLARGKLRSNAERRGKGAVCAVGGDGGGDAATGETATAVEAAETAASAASSMAPVVLSTSAAAAAARQKKDA